MLWTIAVILFVLWLLGLVSSYTMGGFIHILLVLAVVVIVIDRPPENRASGNVSIATKSSLGGRRFCREEEAIFGRAD